MSAVVYFNGSRPYKGYYQDGIPGIHVNSKFVPVCEPGKTGLNGALQCKSIANKSDVSNPLKYMGKNKAAEYTTDVDGLAALLGDVSITKKANEKPKAKRNAIDKAKEERKASEKARREKARREKAQDMHEVKKTSAKGTPITKEKLSEPPHIGSIRAECLLKQQTKFYNYTLGADGIVCAHYGKLGGEGRKEYWRVSGDVEKHFKAQYRSKTGNKWEDLPKFTKVDKRYELVSYTDNLQKSSDVITDNLQKSSDVITDNLQKSSDVITDSLRKISAITDNLQKFSAAKILQSQGCDYSERIAKIDKMTRKELQDEAKDNKLRAFNVNGGSASDKIKKALREKLTMEFSQ
jgi:hypothetical protein